ncbi:unnamed protein product [Closterium sp. Naga37s-1]|nr:unnamed protein product [Closterium sp. Naga37s-1]
MPGESAVLEAASHAHIAAAGRRHTIPALVPPPAFFLRPRFPAAEENELAETGCAQAEGSAGPTGAGGGGGRGGGDTASSSLPANHSQQQARRRSSMADLSDDLLLRIILCSRPTAWDLCRLACVARAWKALCYSAPFWQRLRVEPHSIRPGVEELAARCAGLQELYVDDPLCHVHLLHPIIAAAAHSLTRLVINCDPPAPPAAPAALLGGTVGVQHTGAGEGRAAEWGAMEAESAAGVDDLREASVCSMLWVLSVHCTNVHTIELVAPTSCHYSALPPAYRPDVRAAPAHVPTTTHQLAAHHAPPPTRARERERERERAPAAWAPFAFIELRALWFLTASFRQVQAFVCLCPAALSRPSIFLLVIAWRRHLASLALHMGRLALLDLLPLAKCTRLLHLHLVGACLHGVGAAVLRPGTAASGRGARGTWEAGERGLRGGEGAGLRDEGLDAGEKDAAFEEAAGEATGRRGQGGQYPRVLHPTVRSLTLECVAHEPRDIAALAAMLPALQRLELRNTSQSSAGSAALGLEQPCTHCGVAWGARSRGGRVGGRAYEQEMMAVQAQLRARGVATLMLL